MSKQSDKKSRVSFDKPEEELSPLKDFYNDLDEKARKKGCSLPFLYVFMFVLLVSIIFGLFYVKRNFNIGVKYFNQAEIAGNNDGLFSKVEDELANRSVGDQVSMSFSEQELAYYMGVDEADFPLKKASLNIKTTGIILSGRTRDSYFSIPVKVIFKPAIRDGKLVVEIDQMQGSFVTLPKVIKDGLNSSVDDVINKKLSAVNNFDFKEVILKDGSLELLGVKKSI